jgi:hypothetical protein
MHLPTPLLPFLLLVPSFVSALSNKGQKYAAKAASSRDGIVKLDSASYSDLIGAQERDYAVAVVLTAMDPSFKVRTSAKSARWGREDGVNESSLVGGDGRGVSSTFGDGHADQLLHLL